MPPWASISDSSTAMESELILQLIHAVNTEYTRRHSKNRKYSLRAYAKHLGVDASHLLNFIRGKKGLSRPRLLLLGEKLNLGPNWLERIQATAIRGKKPDDVYKEIEEAHFRNMYHWYYAAICELPLVKGFQPVPEWIAKTLGITVSQAREALNTLQATGALIKLPSGTKKGSMARPVSLTYYRPGQTTAERRENQKEFIRKALAAVDEIPIELRDQSTMVMATSAENLPKARNLIQKFRRDLCKLLQKNGDYQQLYVMSVSLFPISKK